MAGKSAHEGVAAGAQRVRRALVQMRCEADRRANLEKALTRIDEAALQGADLICLQELFTSLYPCQEDEDASRFDWSEPIPGPTSGALSKRALDRGVAIVASLFERRAAGVYHNTALVLDHRGQQVGMYRKMHIRTIRSTTRSSTSRRGISGSAPTPPPPPPGTSRSARWCAETSGFPRPRGSVPWPGPSCSSPPPRSAGSMPRVRRRTRLSTTHGRRCNAPTRSRTAASSRR